jgi:type II secretory pathway component PulL
MRDDMREQTTEILMSRVADGEATASDWELFKHLADQDPTLWREMAEFQHDHTELTAMVAQAIAIADEVEAPAHVRIEQSLSDRMRLIRTWGGWAAAAAVAMAWMIGSPLSGHQMHAAPVNQARLAPSPAQLFQSYLEQGKATGQVVGEMPDKVLLDSRPARDGNGYEIVYLRQIIECARVQDLYTVGTDESGKQVPVPVERVKSVPISGPM